MIAADTAEPSSLTQVLLALGLSKVGPEHHDWLERKVADDDWMARVQIAFSLNFVVAFTVAALSANQPWLVVGALLGMSINAIATLAFEQDYLTRIRRRSLLRAHGLDDRPSRWTNWQPEEFLAMNVALLVLMLGVITAAVRTVTDLRSGPPAELSSPKCEVVEGHTLLGAVVEVEEPPALVAVRFHYRYTDGERHSATTGLSVEDSEPADLELVVRGPPESSERCTAVSATIERVDEYTP